MAVEIPERFRWALAALASQPGGRLLEIGCGTGVAATAHGIRISARRG